jgi:hypothetical protein
MRLHTGFLPFSLSATLLSVAACPNLYILDDFTLPDNDYFSQGLENRTSRQ